MPPNLWTAQAGDAGAGAGEGDALVAGAAPTEAEGGVRGARTRRARAPEGARAKLGMKVDEGSGCEGEGSGERDDENADEGAARAGSGGEKAIFIAAEFERSLFFEICICYG